MTPAAASHSLSHDAEAPIPAPPIPPSIPLGVFGCAYPSVACTDLAGEAALVGLKLLRGETIPAEQRVEAGDSSDQAVGDALRRGQGGGAEN